MYDPLHSVGIRCILKLFFFNYPIVSRCTKFVFQKYCKLVVVIYILLLPWPKEDFTPRNLSRSRNYVSRELYQSLQHIKISGMREFLKISKESEVLSYHHAKLAEFSKTMNCKKSSSESVSGEVEKVARNVDIDTMPVCFGGLNNCGFPKSST